MNLYAYLTEKDLDTSLSSYIERHYGTPPRDRGALLMELETPFEHSVDCQEGLFNEYCGKPVIYVHTRCGGCGDEDDEYSNYRACGGYEWEQRNADTFLAHVSDSFDSTYMDHYFAAVPGDDYDALVREMRAAHERIRLAGDE